MSSSKPYRLALVIAAASALLRLLMAAVTPILPDETYYWEWSRRLAGATIPSSTSRPGGSA